MAEAINMKAQVYSKPVSNRPLANPYRARTGHSLKNSTSKLYAQIQNTLKYAQENKMQLNLSKTKLMLFNPCTSRDFMPELKVDKTRLDLV